MSCGISRRLQRLLIRSMLQPIGRYTKLTWLQLILAKALTSCTSGWRILFRQQFLQAPIVTLFTSIHPVRWQENRSDVSRQVIWNSSLLQIAKVLFHHVVLPSHGFWIFIYWHIQPSFVQIWDSLAPIHLITTFQIKENQANLAIVLYSQSKSEMRAILKNVLFSKSSCQLSWLLPLYR